MFSWKMMSKFSAVLALCSLLVSSFPVAQAQSPEPHPALVITILEGEGALNDIRQRTAREPIIQVEDENRKPIAGAIVLFTMPSSGPGGTFAGGLQSLSTVTDSAGRAVGHGLTPNNISGNYEINVKVSYNGSNTETTIHQQNKSGQSSTTQRATRAVSAKTIIIVVAAAAAAGAVAAILSLQGGSSTTITAGTPTVGAPAFSSGIRIPLHGRSH